MHFGLRTLFVLVTRVALGLFPLDHNSLACATHFFFYSIVCPGFAFMVLSYLKYRRGR